MAQGLGNQISNALRHTPAGGEIRLAEESRAGRVLMRVQDTCAGIAPADLPHVFDRFYRGDQSRAERCQLLGPKVGIFLLQLAGKL